MYTDIFYPDSASWDVESAPDYHVPNILVKEDTLFQAYTIYCAAAIIPHDANLKIRFVGQNYYTPTEPYCQGWQYYAQSYAYTLYAQRWNELMSAEIYLWDPGSATIEYFENDMDTPAFTKIITWN